MRRSHVGIVAVVLATAFAAGNRAGAELHPVQGRFIQRDPIGYADGMNLYKYERSNPVRFLDPHGDVPLEAINAIASQMGIKPIGPPPYRNATEIIKAIQEKLGIETPDGDFGPTTVLRYEQWAKRSGKMAMPLRDPKTAKEVLGWTIKYWPYKDKHIRDCPIGFGAFLALIHFESMDRSTRSPSGKPVYFNAIGGPFGSLVRGESGKKRRTTAVGLAQFTADTAPRNIAYSGEMSIKEAVRLLFKDAGNFGGNFAPEKRKELLWRALGRWEAWHNTRTQKLIKRMGKEIDALLLKRLSEGKSVSEAVSNAELNAILGID